MSATSSAASSGPAVPSLAAGLPPAPPRSQLRQRWILAEPHPVEAAALAKEARLPLVLAELLVARGITQAADAFIFLNPETSHLHDPFLMLGMTAAVERLEAAIARREPVLLYGDYDVDGTTAVVLLKTAIEMLGGIARFHVPHRLLEGYGLQSSVLEAAHAEGARLVITVDTGMRAFKEAETARDLGLDLIITDHHLLAAGDAMPIALAVLNPNQPGCNYPEKSLCGAAIALKLAQAVLERRDPARTRAKTLPSFLKMAAIATIADAVPLKGENRVIAALGLKELCQPVGAGLRALFAVAALDPTAKPITGFDIGFRIAPRINAAGRMDVADDVVELFLTRNAVRAQELAEKLDRLNQDRRASEAHALEVIDKQLQTMLDGDGAYPRECMILDNAEWHRGVLGILASRVVERTGRPALILTHCDGSAHGSGRSVPGFHLLDAISAADVVEPSAALFHRFGGHAHAVGFSLATERIDLLRARMRVYTATHLTSELLVPQLEYDAELSLADVTPELYAWITRCAPFGIGNPEPIFLSRSLTLAAPIRMIQDRHISLQLTQSAPTQATSNSPAISALGWSRDAVGWPVRCARMKLAKGSVVDALYRLRHNVGPYARPQFGGLELELRDLRPRTSGL